MGCVRPSSRGRPGAVPGGGWGSFWMSGVAGDSEKGRACVQRSWRISARTSAKVGTVLACQAARRGRRARVRRRRWATRMSQPRGPAGPGWCRRWPAPTTGAGSRRPGGCGPPGTRPPPASAAGRRRAWRSGTSRGWCRAGPGGRGTRPGRPGAPAGRTGGPPRSAAARAGPACGAGVDQAGRHPGAAGAGR